MKTIIPQEKERLEDLVIIMVITIIEKKQIIKKEKLKSYIEFY